MNWRQIAVIARRDLTVVARSRAVSLPILVLPVVFFVLVPVALTLGARAIGNDIGEFNDLIAMMPEALRRDLAGLEPPAQVIVWALEYLFATLFLIVPLLTSAVIAADSFAGEKERKTLEALIYTPTSDLELYAGKICAPWLAAVAVSTIGYVVFVAVSTLIGGELVGRPIAMTLRWIVFVLVLAPGVAAIAIGALVNVSARVRGFQEAYQLGGLVVLPLVIVLIGQLTGVLYLDLAAVIALSVVVVLVATATLAIGYRSFRRERLLVQL
jgi:ABC-2 type transport system permease protein